MQPTPPAISPLSLHDALPIFLNELGVVLLRVHVNTPALAVDDHSHEVRFRRRQIFPRDLVKHHGPQEGRIDMGIEQVQDRKSTRLNSSHVAISYAVFCLKKKK